MRTERTLRLDGGRHRVDSAPKGDEQPITQVFNLVTVDAKRPAQQTMMLRDTCPVAVTELLHQVSRAFNVGEQQRYCAAWQISHASPSGADMISGEATRP
jgi:hypothetical protein